MLLATHFINLVPSAAPDSFNVDDLLNATHAKFSWTHVNPSTVNGHFRGYKVVVYAPERGGRRQLAYYGAASSDRHEVLLGPQDNTVVIGERAKHKQQVVRMGVQVDSRLCKTTWHM
jgi:hypothetical protein